MKFTESEVRSLSAASDRRGWVQIPDSIPPHFLQIVLEGRHRTLNATRSAAKPKAVVEPVTTAEDIERFRRRFSMLTR